MIKKWISLTERTLKDLEKLSKEKGICLSELVRRILDAYFEELKAKASK